MKVLKGRTSTFVALIVMTLLCLSLVWLTALSTSIQYDINSINNKIQDSQWTKRNLEVEIKSANTLSNLQAKATEMGLVYPSFDEIVYLETETQDEGVHDLAVALREIAYR